EPQLGESGELVAIADWAAKLAGAIVRLAGLLHLAEHGTLADPWQRPIGLPTMEAAVRIGEYLIAHARYTFAEMGADGKIADARYLLRRIEDAGVTTFTRRDAWRWTMGHFATVEDLKPALETLGEHGYIRERPAKEHQGPGRRPGPAYEVNPLYFGNSGNFGNGISTPEAGNLGNSGNGVGADREEARGGQSDGQNCHNCQNSSSTVGDAWRPASGVANQSEESEQ
ncbi:MAG: hypothetical protein C4297_10680, partial [Gemmataceae bacterium]